MRWCSLIIPELRKGRQEDPGALGQASPAYLVSCRAVATTTQKGNRKKVPEEWHPGLFFVPEHAHAHTHTRAHMLTHTHNCCLAGLWRRGKCEAIYKINSPVYSIAVSWSHIGLGFLICPEEDINIDTTGLWRAGWKSNEMSAVGTASICLACSGCSTDREIRSCRLPGGSR